MTIYYIGIISYFGHNCGNRIFMKVERAVDNAGNRADVDKYNGYYYWKLWSSLWKWFCFYKKLAGYDKMAALYRMAVFIYAERFLYNRLTFICRQLLCRMAFIYAEQLLMRNSY